MKFTLWQAEWKEVSSVKIKSFKTLEEATAAMTKLTSKVFQSSLAGIPVIGIGEGMTYFVREK